MTDAATATREWRTLADAATEFPRATRRLLVADRGALPAETPTSVVVQPAYEWLLHWGQA